MSQTQGQFRPITLNEAPPEIAQKLEHNGAESEYRLKLGGFKDDTLGIDLTVVRIEGSGCDGKFCPTYLKYSFGKGSQVRQTLILKCEEWLQVGDQFRPIQPAAEVVWITAWIVLKTDVGDAVVTFTRLGPEISFKK